MPYTPIARPSTTLSKITMLAMSSAVPAVSSHQNLIFMSVAPPVQAESTPSTTPGSPTFVSPSVRSTAPSIHKQLRRSKRAATKNWFKGVAHSICNALSLGRKMKLSTAKSAKNPYHRSSTMRSRLSVHGLTRMTSNKPLLTPPSPTHSQLFDSSTDVRSTISIPDVITTSPSGKRHTLHSFGGPGSEPEPIRHSVLFAHPTITAVMSQPSTPMMASSVASNDSWENGDEKHFSYASSAADSDEASVLGNTMSSVQPRSMYMMSFAGKQHKGMDEDFQRFKNNLDGCNGQLKACHFLSASSEAMGSNSALLFIPTTPSLTSDDSSNWETVSSVGSGTEDNRFQALQALIGNTEASQSCPSILQPGGSIQPTIRLKPVATRLTTAGTNELYIAFTSGAFGAFEPFESPPPQHHQNRPSTPDFASTKTHRKHASRIESCNFDSSWPSTPDFADSATHKSHYSRVESGCDFDFDTTSLPPRPVNPTPDQWLSYFNPSSPFSAGAPVLPPSPPSLPPQQQINTPTTHQIKRKPLPVPNYSLPLNLNKSLPAPPGPTDPKRSTGGIVPAALVMNGNGFPVIEARKAERGSGFEAMYQPRTLSPEELKMKKRAEAKRGEGRKAREVREQRGRMKQMVAAVRKLGFCGTM